MAGNTDEFLRSCYIQDLIDGTYVPFQLMPDEVSHSKAASWQDTEVIGRFAPLKGYSGSAARSVPLTLTFARDLGLNYGKGLSLEEDVGSQVNVIKVSDWFMSFAYPDMDNKLLAPPHPVYLEIANMIRMKGVLRDVTVTYSGPWYYEEGIGTICTVSFNVEEIGGRNVSYADVRAGNYVFTQRSAPDVGKRIS